MRVLAFVCVGVCMGVRVALLTQHVMHVRHIETSFMAPLAPLQFSTLSRKRAIFGKKLLNIKFFFSFSLKGFSKTFLILRRI
jgi:hypothetical protein